MAKRIFCYFTALIFYSIGVVFADNSPGEHVYYKSALKALDEDAILANTQVFEHIYQEYQSIVFDLNGFEIGLTLYNARDEVFEDYIDIPQSIIKATHGRNSVIVTSEAPSAVSDIRYAYSIPQIAESYFCIYTHSGGNWGQSTTCHVIAVGAGDFIKEIDAVAGVEDLDGDGIDEFYRAYTGMEDGLGYLDHASSPIIRVPVDVFGSSRKRDYTRYYRSELRRINISMLTYSTEPPTSFNAGLLGLILEKFLIYQLLKLPEKAWQEFHRDIRHYDAQYFFLRTSDKLERIPFPELIHRTQKALKEWPIEYVYMRF